MLLSLLCGGVRASPSGLYRSGGRRWVRFVQVARSSPAGKEKKKKTLPACTHPTAPNRPHGLTQRLFHALTPTRANQQSLCSLVCNARVVGEGAPRESDQRGPRESSVIDFDRCPTRVMP